MMLALSICVGLVALLLIEEGAHDLPVLRDKRTPYGCSTRTGEEVILPDATTDKLAELRDWIRSTEEDLRIAKRALDAEMIGRMDKEATWSTTVGGYKISAPSPAPSTEYDAVDLRHGLEELQEEGLISLRCSQRCGGDGRDVQGEYARYQRAAEVGGPGGGDDRCVLSSGGEGTSREGGACLMGELVCLAH